MKTLKPAIGMGVTMLLVGTVAVAWATGASAEEKLVHYDSFAPRDKNVANDFWDASGYVEPTLSSAENTMKGSLETSFTSAFDDELIDNTAWTFDISDVVKIRRHPPTGGMIIIR